MKGRLHKDQKCEPTVIRKEGKDADIQIQVCVACIWQSQMSAWPGQLLWHNSLPREDCFPYLELCFHLVLAFLISKALPISTGREYFTVYNWSHYFFFFFGKFIPLLMSTALLNRMTMPTSAMASNFLLHYSRFLGCKEADLLACFKVGLNRMI